MGERVLSTANSLLKYSNVEILLKKEVDVSRQKKKCGEPSCSLPLEDGKSARHVSEETEKALNLILPPKEWEENGQRYRQKVSSEPVVRTDIIKLNERLDLKLQEGRARMLGICPVRRELFTQCFDELVRQITLNCVEQGLLLLRVRDEMRMTCRAYQALYESGIAFGIRKVLQTEKDADDNVEEIERLQNEISQLKEQIYELERRAKQENRRNTEIRLAEQKIHEEEIQFLKKTNHQLKLQLEGIINPKK